MSKTVSANDKSQNTSLKSVLDDKIPQLADQTFNINNWGLGKIGLKLLTEIKVVQSLNSPFFSPHIGAEPLGGKNGGVLSMRMQVILDSSFARPGSAPIWGGKKGEFRDWTKIKAKLDSLSDIKGKLRYNP